MCFCDPRDSVFRLLAHHYETYLWVENPMFYRTVIIGKIPFLVLCAVLIGVQWNCRPAARVDETPQTVQSAQPESADSPVLLGPGDVLEVRFLYTPELNVTQVVRPDGQIALQMIGDVTAQGKTPAQLTAHLLQRYADHLKDPEIVVLVQSLYDRSVFVGGQVINPSMIEMPARMTAIVKEKG